MKELMQGSHASTVPFLAAAYQDVLSEGPARTFCCFGNEEQFAMLSPPAKKLKQKKNMSRCLRSEVGTHSEVDKVPFHTAVWSPIHFCGFTIRMSEAIYSLLFHLVHDFFQLVHHHIS